MPSTKTLPTGICWCGCGAETTRGRFFLTGHDRFAESAVIEMEYGNVVLFLQKHGYGPEGKNPRRELASFRSKAKNSDQEPNPSGRLTAELLAELDAVRERAFHGRRFSGDSTELIRQAREERTEQIEKAIRGES